MEHKEMKNNLSEDINELNNIDLVEKIETKGLKLKKSTKEKLNLLQGRFTDAEAMISTLLSQYDMVTVKENDKYADRKAEIDKFNYLLDSLRNSYVNSLEMVKFFEEKYNEKLIKEVKKNEKVISKLQEENIKLKESSEKIIKEKLEKELQLDEVKESFSRVNLAMTTVEKELSDKNNIIEGLRLHIQSLSEIIENNKKDDKIINNLEKENVDLKKTLNENIILIKELEILKMSNLKQIKDVDELKLQLENERKLNLDLNKEIQKILLERNKEINVLKSDYEEKISFLESEKKEEHNKNTEMYFELKEKIYKLELEKKYK